MDAKVEQFKGRYENYKTNLLSDIKICKSNRSLFDEFFRYQERKLKRKNGLSVLDDSSYKTLYKYTQMFRAVNYWFNNKPWIKLSEEEIKRVYDDLEDGIIVKKDGNPYQDRESYYSKIFKSKPFEIAGKSEISKKIIQSFRKKQDVRFIREEEFRLLPDVANKIEHKLLLWLAFDIGENVAALLRLTKRDCMRQIDPDTKDPEYRINLRKDYLKRSRTSRMELTNFPETVKFLDMVLREKKDSEALFYFDYRNAKKIIDRVVSKTDVRCTPNGEKVTWKDLRSSMACDLLKKGWSTDQVNARLGHKPSSSEIDKYVNFLALDRRVPKKRVHQFKLEELQEEINQLRSRDKSKQAQIEELVKQFKKIIDGHLQVTKVHEDIIAERTDHIFEIEEKYNVSQSDKFKKT